MAMIGYARTSTLHQDAGFDAQLRQLEALGCDKVFSERVSSVAERARLTAALECVREGDTFVVTKLDRLARSAAHLVEIVDALEGKRVALKILDLGMDTSTPTGKAMFQLLGVFAELERSIITERINAGIARAKAAGKHCGRPRVSTRVENRIRKLLRARKGILKVAREVGVGTATVQRIKREMKVPFVGAAA